MEFEMERLNETLEVETESTEGDRRLEGSLDIYVEEKSGCYEIVHLCFISMKKVSALVSSPPMASTTMFILLVSFLLAAFPLSSASSSGSDPSFPYSDHCASFVPESSPKELLSQDSPLTLLHQGYSRAPNQPSLYFDPFDFRILSVRRTDAEGLFMVDGHLLIRDQSYEETFSDGIQSNWSRVIFTRTGLGLRGFWVESSGKLCMVGGGSVESIKGNELPPISVLKLNNLKNSTTVNSLITGTFDLLGSKRSSLSLLILPEINYNFTLVPQENGNGDFLQRLPPSSPWVRRICTFGMSAINKFVFKYSKKVLSAKTSSLFEGSMEYLPEFVSFNNLKCSEEKRRVRFLAVFSTSLEDHSRHYSTFNPNRSLIGEAFWDESQNQTLFFGCRFSGMVRSFDGASVGDCSIRMSFRYPTTVSVRDTAYVVGNIWSSRSDKESGYFDAVTFQQPIYDIWGPHDLEYEYTEIEKSKKLCPGKNATKGYLNAYDLTFDARNSNRTAYCYFQPRFVGNQFFDPFSVQSRVAGGGKANISYNIQVPLPFDSVHSSGGRLSKVLAEGEIDFKTGSLCMIGCRDIGPKNQIWESSFMDCEILVKVEFPLLGENQTYTKGSIESLRSSSDPLYFETLEFESVVFGRAIAAESVYRLDSEIVVVLISTTFACLFTVRQLFYVKKRPQFLPFISISMLILLTLGYLMPLVLTFEALFVRKSDQDKILFEAGGWLMADQVAIRVVKMAAFLLQFYLLILAWFARSTEETRIKIWAAEKKALIVTISLHVVVTSTVVLIHASLYNYRFHHNFWRNLKSFGGLAADAFLLPQILVNGFGNLEGKFLSSSFYMGNTAVRLLTRAYNVYRGEERRAPRYLNASFIYENPNDLIFSNGWDVIVFHLIIMLAIVIFVQQKARRPVHALRVIL